MNEYPDLNNESYVFYDRVMTPLAAQLERKPRRNRGMRRDHHSTSSSSAFDQPSLSHLNDDDDDVNDKGTSRASTPFPIRMLKEARVALLLRADATASVETTSNEILIREMMEKDFGDRVVAPIQQHK
ncbi:hypothetical protein Tco_0351377 [Tanacetum coccineum]